MGQYWAGADAKVVPGQTVGAACPWWYSAQAVCCLLGRTVISPPLLPQPFPCRRLPTTTTLGTASLCPTTTSGAPTSSRSRSSGAAARERQAHGSGRGGMLAAGTVALEPLARACYCQIAAAVCCIWLAVQRPPATHTQSFSLSRLDSLSALPRFLFPRSHFTNYLLCTTGFAAEQHL